MSWVHRYSWSLIPLAIVAVAVFSTSLTGCGPAPQTQEPEEETVVEETVTVEEPSERPAEMPAEEPAAEPAEKPAEKPAEEPAPAEPSEKPAETSAAPTGGGGADAPVSTYAPADDLARQVPEYITELEEAVASEEAFKENTDKIARDANTLVLIALALGLHDQDNQYKKSAGAMMQAAQQLAAAEDFAVAKAAIDAAKKAAAGEGEADVELKWEKVASLPALMKKVPLISNAMKRLTKKASRLKSKAPETQGMAAVIAVIAQGSMANADETIEPNEVEKWHKYCLQMRDEAAKFNAAIRATDAKAVEHLNETLEQSCQDCHKVFHPEEEN